MIAFNGRISFRQYLASKFVKHEIKCYTLSDSVTGYCLKLKTYTGRFNTFDKTSPYNYSIVMDLISPNYLYNNHKLYNDNYYTSLKLVTDLNKKKTHLIETIKKNARGVPYRMSQKINIGESINLSILMEL